MMWYSTFCKTPKLVSHNVIQFIVIPRTIVVCGGVAQMKSVYSTAPADRLESNILYHSLAWCIKLFLTFYKFQISDLYYYSCFKLFSKGSLHVTCTFTYLCLFSIIILLPCSFMFLSRSFFSCIYILSLKQTAEIKGMDAWILKSWEYIYIYIYIYIYMCVCVCVCVCFEEYAWMSVCTYTG